MHLYREFLHLGEKTSDLLGVWGILKSSFPKKGFLFLLFLIAISGCDYDRVPFYYAEIAPQSPTGVSITITNSDSATITWTIPDDSAYPAPEFQIYTRVGNSSITNLVTVAPAHSTESVIPNLSPSTEYSAFVRATNKAGTADSSSISFTTQ